MDDSDMFILSARFSYVLPLIAVQTLKKEGFDWLSMAFIRKNK